jgi:PREDICTED: similar to MGC83197 protein
LKDIAASLNKAIEHKNRLLEFDQFGEKRTKVIDDQTDYYKLHSQHWISSEQRANIKNKIDYLQANKFAKKHEIYVDLDNCKFGEKMIPIIKDPNEIVTNLNEESEFKSDYEVVDCKLIELNQELPKVSYINSNIKNNSQPLVKNQLKNIFNQFKVQDANLMVMSDEGVCLSVRQPYASLIIAGIKLHEGRNWYTSYRGRVWIHASSRVATSSEINSVKTSFSFICKEDNFLKDYPCSLLLGCVDLEDCLPREQYFERYSNGYMDSNYVIIFKNPQPLKTKLPMKAKSNQFFNLDLDVHKAAIKQLF